MEINVDRNLILKINSLYRAAILYSRIVYVIFGLSIIIGGGLLIAFLWDRISGKNDLYGGILLTLVLPVILLFPTLSLRRFVRNMKRVNKEIEVSELSSEPIEKTLESLTFHFKSGSFALLFLISTVVLFCLFMLIFALILLPFDIPG
jgi:hypothetical protein